MSGGGSVKVSDVPDSRIAHATASKGISTQYDHIVEEAGTTSVVSSTNATIAPVLLEEATSKTGNLHGHGVPVTLKTGKKSQDSGGCGVIEKEIHVFTFPRVEFGCPCPHGQPLPGRM